MIPRSLSLHFSLLSVIATMMVVYIHATTGKFAIDSADCAGVLKVQSYFSHQLFHVSLLLFFSMSAYFLSSKLEAGSDVLGVFKSRVKSLCVPYLICSAFWLFVLFFYGRFVGGSVGKYSDSSGGVLEFLESLFIDPVAGQLWFLRDLIVLVALTVIWRKLPNSVLLLVGSLSFVLWMIAPTPTVISMREGLENLVSSEGLTWFLFGFLAARYWKPQELADLLAKTPKKWLFLFGAIYLSAPILYFVGDFSVYHCIHGISISCGTALFYGSLAYVRNLAESRFVARLASYSFLVYLFHYPLLGLVEKLVLSKVNTPLVHAVVYLFIPICVVAILIVSIRLVGQITPQLLAIINGGRAWRCDK